MKRFWPVVLAAIAVLGFSGARLARAGAFDDAHDAAVKANPAGLICALQSAGGKTRFQVGERIPVRLSFISTHPGMRVCIDPNPFWATDIFHVDAQSGVRTVVPYKPPGYSGPGPRISLASAAPSDVDLTLNDFLRFDHPGVYRVYATTDRLMPDSVDPLMETQRDRIPSCSTALTVTVVAANAEWAHRQAQQALRMAANPMTVFAAMNTLRYLGTHEAARILLELIAREGLGARWTTILAIGGMGLHEFADQQWVAGEVERDIRRKDLPISAGFLEAAGRIPVTDAFRVSGYRDSADLRTFWETVGRRWRETADALPGKSRDAAPATAYSLAYLMWDRAGEALRKDSEIAARCRRIEGLLPEMLDRLPDDYLYDALGDDWPHLQSAPLLPSLRRLWRRASASSKTDADLQDKIWLRFGEQLPDADRRKFVLETMTACRIPVSAEAICSLPDATLPEIDDALASRLSRDKNEDTRVARCTVIARYATAKILPRMRSWYVRNRLTTDCQSRDLMLSYFLRVAPDEGTPLVEQALRERNSRDCYRFLEDLAQIRPSPQLAAIVKAHLHDPDKIVAEDAADALNVIEYPEPVQSGQP